jgi:hypothetical protein
MALLIFAAALEEVDDFVVDFAPGCSRLEEFLAFTGILPDMYRAARPAPAFNGGSRLAMMDVERGIIVVSSSYSAGS